MKVFLDTSVLVGVLRGEPGLNKLFAPEIQPKVTYAINPVVLQELLLVIGSAADSSTLDDLTKSMEVLPVDTSTVEESLKTVRELRNRTIHANELLILGSAQSCDYLVTMDRDLQQIAGRATMKAISPEELLKLLEEHK